MSPEEMFSTIRLVRIPVDGLGTTSGFACGPNFFSLGDIEGACQIGFRDMEGQPTNPGSFWLVGFVGRQTSPRAAEVKPRFSLSRLVCRITSANKPPLAQFVPLVVCSVVLPVLFERSPFHVGSRRRLSWTPDQWRGVWRHNHRLQASMMLASLLHASLSFPGPVHLHPQIHFAPSVVSEHGGWHDIAGAFTHKGLHHIFQGQGWNHATSQDLVTWSVAPHGPRPIHETYKGMDSNTDPCSGFVTQDEDGTVCAGFRQCFSSHGINATGFQSWDVPLELRCALDGDLKRWAITPDYLFNVTFYRPVPYDPARPWREKDGYWYVLLSFDHCNATTKALPCESGGMLVMWRSPTLRGAHADWQYVGPVFTSNATVLAEGSLAKEFVTIDYIGRLAGDPSTAPLGTRVFLNNVGGNGEASAAAPAPRHTSSSSRATRARVSSRLRHRAWSTGGPFVFASRRIGVPRSSVTESGGAI